jgi:hypothetical protein
MQATLWMLHEQIARRSQLASLLMEIKPLKESPKELKCMLPLLINMKRSRWRKSEKQKREKKRNCFH